MPVHTADGTMCPSRNGFRLEMLTGMVNYEVSSQERAPQPAAVCAATLAVDELPAWLGTALGTVAGYLPAHRSFPVGPPFARYHRLADGRFDVEAGFPVPATIEDSVQVHPVLLPGGSVASTVHVGPYDEMVPGYHALEAWITERGGELAGDPWEVYLSDPGAQPDPATWRTEIVQPYREKATAPGN
jgi:effector-binding domain-containing protein